MTENPKDHPTGNAEKDPDDWTTGDEPMTGAQASYLKTLSEEANQFIDFELIPAWGKQAAAVLRKEGIINGYLDGTFRPQYEITREEAAAIILEMLEWQYSEDSNITK